MHSSVFAQLKERVRDYLLGENSAQSLAFSPAYRQHYVKKLDIDSLLHWTTLRKGSKTKGDLLWDDQVINHHSQEHLDQVAVTSSLTTTYLRLALLTKAFCTNGTSLYQKQDVLDEIRNSFRFLFQNHYHYDQTLTPFRGNWWHAEIGIPPALLGSCILLLPHLTSEEINNYLTVVEYHTPDSISPSKTLGNNRPMTGANLIDKALVVLFSGILREDCAPLEAMRQDLRSVFDYVTTGDGFYRDGSFIQHFAIGYMGGYGQIFYEKLGVFFRLLGDTPFEIRYPNREEQMAYDMIPKGVLPLYHKNLFMDMVASRGVTRPIASDKIRGALMLASLLPVVDSMREGKIKTNLLCYLKFILLQDSAHYFATINSLPALELADHLLQNASLSPKEFPAQHLYFGGMDKQVYHHKNFTLAISAHSSRTFGNETMNREGKRTWNISDGKTYLYTSNSSHYQKDYWATVDPTRLSGTTVLHKLHANGSCHLRPNSFSMVGGATLPTCGAIAMHTQALGEDGQRTGPVAKKSYLMFRSAILCLGSGISGSDQHTVETIVDNRRVASVDGTVLTQNHGVEPSTQGIRTFSWLHQTNPDEPKGIGYFFPTPTPVSFLLETRQDNWSTQGVTSQKAEASFATLWIDHGTQPQNEAYAYVLLPEQTAEEVKRFSEENTLEILEQSTAVHLAKDSDSRTVNAIFWNPEGGTAAGFSSTACLAMTLQSDGKRMTLALSDPTHQLQDPVNLSLPFSIRQQTSSSAHLSLLTQNTIRFLPKGLAGETVQGEFLLTENFFI